MKPGSLAYKIFLDRYALKDLNRDHIQVGDLVIVQGNERRDLALVQSRTVDHAVVRYEESGESATVFIDLLDKPTELSYGECCSRVSKAVAGVEKEELREELTQKFYDLLSSKAFVPGGRVLAGAGSGQNLTLSNCYVLPSPEDSRHGIYKSLEEWTELQAIGGGTGVNLSTLRPRNAFVAGVNGRSSGAVSWGAMYSHATGITCQGGCLPFSAVMSTDKGEMTAIELATRLEAGEVIQSRVPKGYKPFITVFRNGLKPMLKIVTDTGHSIVVSEDHKMMIMGGISGEADYAFIEAKALTVHTEGKYNHYLGCETHGSAGFGLARIISIAPAGMEDSLDFEVAEDHILCADGIYSSNSRRGAGMLILEVWHPDIEEFVTIKQTMGLLTNVNISVGVTNDFMEAVKSDSEWPLLFPDTSFSKYKTEWDGNIKTWRKKGYPTHTHRTVKARELWNSIAEGAWKAGEPGLFFIDRANDMSNSYYFNRLICTNPCSTLDTLVECPEGNRLLGDIQIGDEIVTFKDGVKGVGIVSKIEEHKDYPVFLLTFSNGFTMRSTDGHVLYTGDVGFEKEVTVKQLRTSYDYFWKYQEVPISNTLGGCIYITDIKEDGVADVKDIYEASTDTWVTSGIVNRGCGEIVLPSYGLCNLGHINLSKFVEDGKLNKPALREAVKAAVRFLDNCLDLSYQPLPEIKERIKEERRIGLGTLGLAEMLIKLGIRYGSEECIRLCDDIYNFIKNAAYQTSEGLGKEKGCYEAFNATLAGSSGFWQANDYRMRTMRNVCILTQAPCGTVATMLETSTGIEPFFAFEWNRTGRLGSHAEQANIVKEFFRDNPEKKNLPDYFVNAMSGDITPRQHIEVQAAIQKHVCNSISKTVNLPSTATVADVQECYELLYSLGCKGGTIYRDKSRDVQVLNVIEEPIKEAVVVAEIIKKRPRVRDAKVISVKTAMGTAHVTLTFDDKQPLEVFIDVGKGGSDIKALSEAFGRLISLLLRVPSSFSSQQRLEEVIKQLKDIGGARPLGFGKTKSKSLPDSIAKALEELSETVNIEELTEVLAEPILGELELRDADLCPECGNTSLVQQDGCETCLSCGNSLCQ